MKKYEIKLTFTIDTDYQEKLLINWIKNNLKKYEQYFPDGAENTKTGFMGEVACYRVDVKGLLSRIFAEVKEEKI